MRVEKDYYRILEVAGNASADAIRKAYRRLAKQYHPDKVQENTLALERFHAIRDAYEVLGNERRRRRYDEERWMAGLARTRQPNIISADWLLEQCRKLDLHVRTVDTHRMQQGLLAAYIEQLISPDHILVLRTENQREKTEAITTLLSGIA